MKGEALLKTMAGQIEAQCEERRQSAQAQAQAIRDEAEAESRKRRDSTLQALATEMDVLDERWRLKAEAEAAKAELAMKNRVVEEVIETVENRLQELAAGDGFKAVLDALLAELMAAAPGNVVVLAPEKHVDHVKAWLESNGHGGLTVQADEAMADGVAVQDEARTFRISNTLRGRLERVSEQARKICMRSLFGTAAG